MKITSTKKILAVSVLLLMLLAAANYFLFASIKNTSMEASELSLEADEYDRELSGASRESVNELRTLIQKVSWYLVGRDDVVTFIENIEEEARNNGIVLLIRSVETEAFGDPADTTATKETMRLKLEARGAWKNNLRFVYFLENLPYKINVKNVEFSKMMEGERITGGELNVPEVTGGVENPGSAWRTRIELTVLKQK